MDEHKTEHTAWQPGAEEGVLSKAGVGKWENGCVECRDSPSPPTLTFISSEEIWDSHLFKIGVRRTWLKEIWVTALPSGVPCH